MSDFFGKLRSGAEKVAFEADKMTRLNKAKGELEKTKGQLQGEFAKLGEIYYSARASGEVTGPEYDRLIQGIDDLVKQVEAKDAEVKKIETEVYGTAASQPVASVFGQSQPQPAAAPAQAAPASAAPTMATPATAAARTTKFCPNCGTEIPIETKFCTNCGSKV